MRYYRSALSILLAIAAGATLSSCGGVPSDAVATVADDPILTADFNRWVEIAAHQQGIVKPGVPVPPLTPPDFKECIAQKKVAAAKSKDSKNKSDAALKTECKSEFDQQKQQVMQLLITTAWIKGQASLMGIKVSDAEIKKKFEETKNQAFPKPEAYKKFLKTTGQTEQSLLDRIRIEIASQKIREAVIAKAGEVNDKDAEDYYQKNKEQFGTPETRSYHMIFAKDKAKAEAARKELEGGASWKDVAKKYSGDAQTKNSGGEVKDAVKGQQDPALDKVVFSIEKGKVSEPVKGSLGWYVVEVDSTKKGSTTPFTQVKSQIVQQVKAQREQEALQTFVKSFQEKWKAKTDCKKDYVIDLCKNAPKQAEQPGPGTVQQAPPQGG